MTRAVAGGMQVNHRGGWARRTIGDGEMETTLRGVGVSHGVAIGEVRHMGTAVLEPPAKQIPTEDAEREQGAPVRPWKLWRPI